MALAGGLWAAGLVCAGAGDLDVPVYAAGAPPAVPLLEQLPLLSQVTRDGVTWVFAAPCRVGRFVTGDYYVAGEATVAAVTPEPTPANGRHGSMLNIQPGAQRSGFDSRLEADRYDPALRVYPPVRLRPGDKLVSSRSVETNLPSVMRPYERSPSPVASVSILTCLAAPVAPDAFRPSYAQGAGRIYYSRRLRRELLPALPAPAHAPSAAEFAALLRRPWIDSVFFNFDVPSEYMPSYGRENAYFMSFAGLLAVLDLPAQQKEPLIVFLTQYGIDLFGLVEQGHPGWQAFGGHGSGRKFPIVFAGLLMGEPLMAAAPAQFGEDMQTIWAAETPPAGTWAGTWHTRPEAVVYAGHAGVDGEQIKPGWGPYEHRAPGAWTNTLGELYRRCCTSVSWVGEALAARLIPGMQAAWNHPQFFAYADRWMTSPDDPRDLETMRAATGLVLDTDFLQGQVWKVLSGGGYSKPECRFIDEMWALYRNRPVLSGAAMKPGGVFAFEAGNLSSNTSYIVQATTNLAAGDWTAVRTQNSSGLQFTFTNAVPAGRPAEYYRVGPGP